MLFLLFYDYRLAIFAILLWLILDAFLNRNKIYVGGKALIKTRKSIYVSFSLTPEKKKSIISIGRGMRILRANIEPSYLIQFALNVSRNVARIRGKRRMKAKARVIDYTLPHKKFFKVSTSATIRRSVLNLNFPNIKPNDLRANLYAGRGKVSLIIVLDSSASMMYSIKGIIIAFRAISKEARKHRDRVSLIVSKGFSSAIAQFPTTNFNLLLGKIRKIGLDDFTPLASGMYRAVNLAIKEKRRGYEPVIVIISDGNVNVPLGRRLYNKWFSSDPSVQSTLEVGYLIKKKGIETIVINTKHREIIYEQNTTIVSGTELLLNLAKITEGAYIGIRG